MKKAASIFLRAEITPRDIQPMIRWLENPRITRYLNEDPHITRLLRHLLEEVPAPMLSLHFNRDGRLFLVCRPDGETIGFVKLRKLPQPEAYEIVYVIGEESLWGQGFGEASIRSALAMVFLQWRAKKVIAKICPDNQRSIRSVCACGFRLESGDGPLLRYCLTDEMDLCWFA